jgi:2-dehydropantoate 2-reductase
MRFAILGAGALGSILGAHLARAGHEVAMIARGERARVLQRQGLVLNGLSDIKARCAVIDEPQRLRETDTLIVATKAIDTARSLDAFKHLKLETAFSVQNGVLKNELLARLWGFSRVLGAMADFSGELLANGEVKFTRNVALHVGEEKGGTSPRTEALAHLIDTAGVRCVAAPDIRTREWSKFAGWIASFPLAVLTRQITWKFMMDERSAGVIVRIVREAAALAAALRIELVDMSPLPVPSIVRASEAEAVNIVQAIGQGFREKSPEHRMSAQQDVLRGSRLEYEETLGFALQKAREVGVAMPTLDTCYRIVSVAHPGDGPHF